MSRPDPKLILWRNLAALMRHHWGCENLTRLAREARTGPGTATRIKEMDTSVGLDVVDRMAQVFGLELWHLLTPGLDPSSPPAAQPITEAERQQYEQLLATIRQLIMPS